jgi:hypothetical protein
MERADRERVALRHTRAVAAALIRVPSAFLLLRNQGDLAGWTRWFAGDAHPQPRGFDYHG